MPPAAGTATGGGKNCAGRTVGGVPPPPYVKEIDWYDAVDVVGLDAYWVLNGTTVPDVVAQWRPHVAYSRALAAKWNKTLVFTEIGYCSGLCDWRRKRKATLGDYRQQAVHFQALFEAMRGEEHWFDGAFWWNCASMAAPLRVAARIAAAAESPRPLLRAC